MEPLCTPKPLSFNRTCSALIGLTFWLPLVSLLLPCPLNSWNQVISHFAENIARTPYTDSKVLHDSLMSLTSSPPFSSLTQLWPPRPFCYSWNMPGMLLLQDLSTEYLLYLVFFPQMSSWLLPFLLHCWAQTLPSQWALPWPHYSSAVLYSSPASSAFYFFSWLYGLFFHSICSLFFVCLPQL